MGDSEDIKPKFFFRNYVPKSTKLRQYCLAKISVKALEEQIDNDMEMTIEESQKEDALTRIAPKKPNWDLKRDVERKLTILSHRTDRAIVQLINRKVQETSTATEKIEDKPDGKSGE
eukprot:GHVU01052698.1.p1 GENE.GHVU01052698.1~~GHVU01052698.1.p1  ORF type:complete len:129 (+),score=28.01 GHVU01052698.1:37-387(+)